jgi:hypothetical protein
MPKAPTFGRHPTVRDLNSRFNRRRRRYATRPPSGFYDPALDQQLAAAGRGLKDLRQDTEKYGARASDDLSIATNRTNQQAGYSLSDLARNQGRETQDYWTARQSLARNYGNQASSQLQAGNSAGLLSGGFLAQAARKRAANQQLDVTALGTTNRRRLQDEATAKGRIVTARDQHLGDLNLNYLRGTEDRGTNLTMATREFRNYGVDVGETRFYEARNAGWTPPPLGRRRRRGGISHSGPPHGPRATGRRRQRRSSGGLF